jgi:hypothetical protein
MPFARSMAGALAGFWAGAALAQTGPPLPPPRPADLRPPPVEAAPSGVPLPPPRPADLGPAPSPATGTALGPAAPDVSAAPDVPAAPDGPAVAEPSPAAAVPPVPAPLDAPAPAALLEHEACLASLARLGVRFEPMPPIREGPCGGRAAAADLGPAGRRGGVAAGDHQLSGGGSARSLDG